MGEADRRGRPRAAIDAQIAATALQHDLTLATRNSGGLRGPRRPPLQSLGRPTRHLAVGAAMSSGALLSSGATPRGRDRRCGSSRSRSSGVSWCSRPWRFDAGLRELVSSDLIAFVDERSSGAARARRADLHHRGAWPIPRRCPRATPSSPRVTSRMPSFRSFAVASSTNIERVADASSPWFRVRSAPANVKPAGMTPRRRRPGTARAGLNGYASRRSRRSPPR